MNNRSFPNQNLYYNCYENLEIALLSVAFSDLLRLSL